MKKESQIRIYDCGDKGGIFAFHADELAGSEVPQLFQNTWPMVDEVLEALGPGAKFSTLFKMQLAWIYNRQPLHLAGGVYHFGFYNVIDELRALEGLGRTSTRTQSPFYGPLNGFWHKHFFGAQSLPENLIREIERNGDRFIHRDVKPVLAAERQRLGHDRDAGEATGIACHVMTMKALEERGRGKKPRLTGDWIVYAHHESSRSYLTLAAHAEEQNLLPIAERLLATNHEFPFVSERLKSNGLELLQKAPAASLNCDNQFNHPRVSIQP